MNQPMQPIIQHLFQVSTLGDVPRERLESFVEEYPCFGFGHYLLSRKLRAENSDQFNPATQKTSLYFSNPFWLNWLLENTPAGTEHEVTAKDFDTEMKVSEAIIASPEANIADPEVSIPDSEVSIPDSEIRVAETHAADTPPAEAIYAGPQTSLDDPYIIPDDPNIGSGDPHDNAIAPQVASGFPLGIETGPSAAEILLAEIGKAREIRESFQKINEGFETGDKPADEPVTGTTEEAIGHPGPHSVEQSIEEPIRDIEPPFILEEVTQAAEITQPAEIAQPTEFAEPAEVTQPQPTAATEPGLVFEPYHTIDYFASQGIRLSQEENPGDSLGRQLKSFTEWLKVMRRLPQNQREIVPDRATEESIQTFAAHSIEGKEVVTETMAEVLAKQGMPERARIVYEKLSLLNPDKSAYFAAKIQQLNIS